MKQTVATHLIHGTRITAACGTEVHRDHWRNNRRKIRYSGDWRQVTCEKCKAQLLYSDLKNIEGKTLLEVMHMS